MQHNCDDDFNKKEGKCENFGTLLKVKLDMIYSLAFDFSF